MTHRPPAASSAVGRKRVQTNNDDAGKGESQPPKNRIVARHETVTMLAYSPRKNIANLKLEYSVWKPATSSDSASGRSNGRRLVSAIAAMKKHRKPASCGRMFHRGRKPQRKPCCAAMISRKLNDPASSNTPTTDMVNASS